MRALYVLQSVHLERIFLLFENIQWEVPIVVIVNLAREKLEATLSGNIKHG